MSAAENDSLGSCPPPLSIKLPKLRELPRKSKPWSDDHLPVDIVLLTVEDCEFLACYTYMGNPIKMHHNDLGHVYFGSMGDDDDDEPLKVALLKCSAGAAEPGGALIVVKNAVMKLRPKAIFSVGFCEGLKPESTQLGDVVVSSKLTTEALKTPVGKGIANLIKHSAEGWNPPLDKPDAHQVHVHNDGEILSGMDRDTAKRHHELNPRVIALEMEGKDVFAAAHDLKIEWVIVKGISHFADGNKIPENSWKSHACVMAASLVFNMLNDTVVFKQWPHYKGPSEGNLKTPRVEYSAEQQLLHVPSEKGPQPEKRAFGTNEEGASFPSTVIKHNYENLTDDKQQIVHETLTRQIQVYTQYHKVSTPDGVGALIEHIQKTYHLAVESVGLSSLVIKVQCLTLESLESLWKDYCSGHLNEVAERHLVTDEIKRKLNLETLTLKTTIEEENYLICKKALMEKTNLSAEEESSASQLKRDLPCSSSHDAKRRKIETFPLEKCQERLKSKYYVMSKVTITPWVPSSAVHIDTIDTRLSWFKDDVKPRGVTKKKLEDYTEIFTSQEHPNLKRILVYGRPGIGKSTFCKKAAYDWSQQSKPILRQFNLVLLIKLRDVCNLHDVADILKASELLANDSSISVDSLYEYIKDEKNNVLLILDGYDEYSYDDTRESPVCRIWDSRELSDCTVVLTMRPTRELKSIPLQFEINGFDDEKQIKMFSLKFLKDDSDVKEFYEYLKEHNLREIAEIPLLLRMLCLLWTETDLTRNLTSRANIYTLFTQTMLSHLSEKEDTVPCKIKKVDEYAEGLSKLGKLAYDALLKGNVALSKSEVTDDLQIIIDKFTEVGLCHPFKPSRVDPMESISFIHKSIQEYIAGTYLKELAVISRNDEKAIFLSELDSTEKILKMKEVLKFASELSGCSACAILNHLGRVAEEEGLTEYQESIAMDKTPSLQDVDETDFLMLTVDIFLCCSAETRQNLFPTFLSYIGSVLLINSDQLHRIANEHLLKSTEPPNLIFFPEEDSKHVERDYRDLVSVMEDLNAVVVSSSGVKNASQFLKKYPFRPIEQFFLKKEKNIMHLYFTMIVDESTSLTDPFPYPTEMLKELIASTESTAQQRKESDAHQSSKQNTRITVCSTQDTDSTFLRTHHCLSRVWSIYTPDHLDDMPLLAEVLPLVIAPKHINWSYSNLNLSDFMSINFTDKLQSLVVEEISTDDMSAVIDTFMRQSPNLGELHLSFNRLGKGLSVLTSLLKYVPHLKGLYLTDVMMTKQQVHQLTTAVHQSKISHLTSNYHDRKGNPLPEDKWPSEDYWKERPWLVPSEYDESGSSAESVDEPGSSATEITGQGSRKEPEQARAFILDYPLRRSQWLLRRVTTELRNVVPALPLRNVVPGASAKSKDEPGSSAEPKDEPGSSADSKDEPGSSAEPKDEPGSSAESKDEPGSSAEPKDETVSSAEPKDEPGSSADSKDEPGSSATEITGEQDLGRNLNKQEPLS